MFFYLSLKFDPSLISNLGLFFCKFDIIKYVLKAMNVEQILFCFVCDYDITNTYSDYVECMQYKTWGVLASFKY